MALFNKGKKEGESGTGDSSAASLEGLHKAFGDMTKALNDMPKAISASVVSGLRAVAAEERDARARTQNNDDDDDGDGDEGDDVRTKISDVDLEKMSRSQFMEHIAATLGGVIDKKLKPLQKTMSKTMETGERDKVTAKFEKARAEHPDFDEWKDEMATLLKTHGYLDPEELYTLARAKNIDKAKEVDAKLAKDAEEKSKTNAKADTGGKKEKPSFLGLLPTSGTTSSKEDHPKYETTKDAATAAFDEILGGASEDVIGEVQT